MRVLGVVTFAAVALVAGSQASAATKNACALVTEADASKAIFGKVGSTKHSKAGAFDMCTYTGGGTTIVVKTRPLSKALFDKAARALSPPVLQADNVSPYAWVSFVSNGISLIAWKKGNEVVVNVLNNPSQAPTIVQTLATRAVSRL